MANVLYMNYAPSPDGLEQATFGDFARTTSHRPDAVVPVEECLAADGIISGSANHDVGDVNQYPNCKIIVRMGVGYDNLDSKAWGARGVPVCNVPDYGTSEVADHAVSLMLTLARGTHYYATRLAADPVGNWGWAPGAPLMRRLRGQTFGIIGLGRIGMAAARRAKGFDMDIVFYDPELPNGVELGVGYRRARSLKELMEASDAISLHAPFTDSTRNIINAESLSWAKDNLILVNTARGPLVDLDALRDALKSGRIAGAALDVLPSEPPVPLHPLFAALQAGEPWIKDRLILTPHAAFFSPPANLDIRRKAAEVVLHYLRDGRLTNCVNGHLLRKNS
ncbi:MAG: C-terminal binding protein [Alphaproteobacteria bacterium]|nr:C-terminal binding protein [Alphaproteobacteria bacterium]